MTRVDEGELQLLDAIKAAFNLSTDAELARFVGIRRGAISAVRKGKARLGPLPRLRVIDRIGFSSVLSLVASIAPESLIDRLRHHPGMRIDAVHPPCRPTENPGGRLLDCFKVAFEFPKDEALADFLGLGRQTVSAVRMGRSTLGTGPRLKILNRLEPFELEDVEAVLASTAALIKRINDYTAAMKGRPA